MENSKTLALQGIQPNGGGGALSSKLSKLVEFCHCEDERSEDVAIAKLLHIDEITTSHFANAPRNDKSSSETNLTSYRLNDSTSFSDTVFSRKRVAFTLAEVLITLGIIGVVASLTMPNLIEKYQKHQTVTKLKYVYSVMSQALVSSQAETGDIKDWDFGTSYQKEDVKRIVHEHVLPYIQYADEGFYSNRYWIRLKNGIIIAFHLDGSSDAGLPPSVLRMRVNLKNDIKSAVKVSAISSRNEFLNFSRYDFTLDFSPGENKFRFFNWGGNTRNGIMNTSIYKCSKDNPPDLRQNCGALIMLDGWQISDDYPW